MGKPMRHELIDMTGQVVGRLTVISRAAVPPHLKSRGRARWTCICSCGEKVSVDGRSLRSGETQSCGCLRLERNKAAVTTHGHARPGKHTPTYRSWMSMRARCLNPNCNHYERYGGRGIKICDAWIESFEAFIKDMGLRPDGTSLDRIDVNGNYEPANCRWATPSVQSANQRDALIYELNGERMPLLDWAKRLNIPYGTLKNRIRRYNWPVEQALTTPVLIKRKRKNAVV